MELTALVSSDEIDFVDLLLLWGRNPVAWFVDGLWVLLLVCSLLSLVYLLFIIGNIRLFYYVFFPGCNCMFQISSSRGLIFARFWWLQSHSSRHVMVLLLFYILCPTTSFWGVISRIVFLRRNEGANQKRKKKLALSSWEVEVVHLVWWKMIGQRETPTESREVSPKTVEGV